MATPRVPNRPARPTRCMYVAASEGSSRFTTKLTRSRSMPRAARSVVTATRSLRGGAGVPGVLGGRASTRRRQAGRMGKGQMHLAISQRHPLCSTPPPGRRTHAVAAKVKAGCGCKAAPATAGAPPQPCIAAGQPPALPAQLSGSLRPIDLAHTHALPTPTPHPQVVSNPLHPTAPITLQPNHRT